MPWFPDFVAAGELARRQTRAAGLADPVAQYFNALGEGDARMRETARPGGVVIHDPRHGGGGGARAASPSWWQRSRRTGTSANRWDRATPIAAQPSCVRTSPSPSVAAVASRSRRAA